MFSTFIVMSIISALWLSYPLAIKGWFGIRIQRRVKFLIYDKEESSRLLRVLERYKAGDYTVQFSQYNNNLLFSKVAENQHGFSYDISQIYIVVENKEDISFGWMNDESYHYRVFQNAKFRACRSAINTKAYNELVEFLNFINEENSQSKRNWFGKRKNEEIHLS